MPLRINCDWCGKTFTRKPSTVKRHNFCSRICLGKANAERFKNFCRPECGHSFKRWTGVCGYSPLVKGVPIHRRIMEETLGRVLTEGEEVHHIDFNHHNNHIENLVVLRKSEHSKIHAAGKERDKYGKFIKTK